MFAKVLQENEKLLFFLHFNLIYIQIPDNSSTKKFITECFRLRVNNIRMSRFPSLGSFKVEVYETLIVILPTVTKGYLHATLIDHRAMSHIKIVPIAVHYIRKCRTIHALGIVHGSFIVTKTLKIVSAVSCKVCPI